MAALVACMLTTGDVWMPAICYSHAYVHGEVHLYIKTSKPAGTISELKDRIRIRVKPGWSETPRLR
jgi:hypothetical protein